MIAKLAPACLGASLAGAGGGGFLLLVTREPHARAQAAPSPARRPVAMMRPSRAVEAMDRGPLLRARSAWRLTPRVPACARQVEELLHGEGATVHAIAIDRVGLRLYEE